MGAVESTHVLDSQKQTVLLEGGEKMAVLRIDQTKEGTNISGLYAKSGKLRRSKLGNVEHKAPPVLHVQIDDAGEVALTVNEGGRVLFTTKECRMLTIHNQTKVADAVTVKGATIQNIHLQDGAMKGENLTVDTVTVINGSLDMTAAKGAQNIRLHGEVKQNLPVGATNAFSGPTQTRHDLVLPSKFTTIKCNCRTPCVARSQCRNFCQIVIGEHFHMCSPCFIALQRGMAEVKV